jgi:hypothetical protein
VLRPMNSSSSISQILTTRRVALGTLQVFRVVTQSSLLKFHQSVVVMERKILQLVLESQWNIKTGWVKISNDG